MAGRVEYSKGRHVKYTIDDEHRIVVAKLTVDCYEPQEKFISAFYKESFGRQSEPLITISDFFEPDYCTEMAYTGVAKCHPDDVFDVEFGKNLALARAKKKHAYALHLRLQNEIDFIDDLFHRLAEDEYSLYNYCLDCDTKEKDLLANKEG